MIMNFDDRWGPVPTLAAAQLRRVGNLYFRAAKQLEEAVETGKPMPPPSSQQSHVIVRVAAEWKPASKENYRHCPNWKDAPSEFEPVAMFNPNATFSRMAYYRLEDFNRMSMYHTPEGEPRLWMVAIPSTKALPLNLPSWESIKDAQPIDYDDGDLIGWHFDYREEWIQAKSKRPGAWTRPCSSSAFGLRNSLNARPGSRMATISMKPWFVSCADHRSTWTRAN